MKSLAILFFAVIATCFANRPIVCNSNSCFCPRGQNSQQHTNPQGVNTTCYSVGIPVNIPSGYNFTATCNDLFQCYSNCTFEKSACDEAFCGELAGRCDSLTAENNTLCFEFANIACSSVQSNSFFFSNAQRRYCACENPPQES